MKHAILGAGAIGGLVGTALASIGEDVSVVVRPEKLANYPATLTLERPSGTVSGRVKALVSLAEPVDVLWIATKTYQLEKALESVKVAPSCIVPLLNGVEHIAVLRARFGNDRVVPGTIAVEAERIAAGRFIQRSPFVRLNLAAIGRPLLSGIIQELGQLGFTCQFIENEQTLLWSKLTFLAPFALVTSASGMNVGEILANPEWKQKLDSSTVEACAVANASDAEIDTEQARAAFSSVPATMRSSMQKDLLAGRELELDAIGGPIVRDGKLHAINVATTAELMAAIRAKATH
jgi:2-dehydropantoate 2-reductase